MRRKASVKKRIKEAGVKKFYYNRRVLQYDVGTIGEFILSATSDVTYVGGWLSSSLKQDIKNAIKKIASNGVTFKFCIMRPTSGLIPSMAKFFNSTPESIKNQIEETIITLYNIRSELKDEQQSRFNIYLHDELITTSFWMLDSNCSSARIQLDTKLVRTPRWFSFGMEVIKSKSDFFDTIKHAYEALIVPKNFVTYDYIEAIDGTRKRKKEIQDMIISQYPFNPDKPYIFISYSHKNELCVLEDVMRLKQLYNCWIDFENLDGGRDYTENDWTDKVKPVLENSQCVGVISYVSEDGFTSDGYIRECNWIKVKRPRFYSFLVDFDKTINSNIMLGMINSSMIVGELPQEKQVRKEALCYITQATSSKKESYYHYEKEGTHLDSTDFKNWIRKLKLKS